MIISKNTKLDDILKMKDGNDVFITKDVALDREKLAAVFSHFKNSYISILSGYDKNQSYSSFETTLYSEAEISVLLENAEFVNKTFNKSLSFDAGYSGIDDAILTSRLINQVVSEINSLKVDGRPLSPFERFVYAYHFASNRLFKEEPDYQDESYSRNLISCLLNESIVCVGFSNILTTILNKVNVPTAPTNVVNSHENKLTGKHLANYVRIDDDIYDIHGIYYADASADAAKSLDFEFGNNSFNKALRQLSNVHILNLGVFLDATVSKSEKITSSIEKYLKPAPTIMSKLFPEISSGLSQGQMIESYIPYFIQKNNLDKKLKKSIENLSIISKDKIFTDCISNLLNFEEFYSHYKKSDFETYLNNLISSLKLIGLSDEKIFELFNSMIQNQTSQDYIQSLLVERFQSSKFYKPEILVKKEMLSLSRFLDSFPEKVKAVEIEQKNKDDLCFEFLINLSNDVIAEHLYKNHESISKINLILLTLLNNGVSLQEIQSILFNKLESFDMAEGFIKTDKIISKKVGLDESEFYFGYDEQNIDFIFNEPYEELFESLSQNAPFVEQEKFKSAILKIFLAQGHTKEKASELTAQMLRHTNIENPKQNQKKIDD